MSVQALEFKFQIPTPSSLRCSKQPSATDRAALTPRWGGSWSENVQREWASVCARKKAGNVGETSIQGRVASFGLIMITTPTSYLHGASSHVIPYRCSPGTATAPHRGGSQGWEKWGECSKVTLLGSDPWSLSVSKIHALNHLILWALRIKGWVMRLHRLHLIPGVFQIWLQILALFSFPYPPHLLRLRPLWPNSRPKTEQ